MENNLTNFDELIRKKFESFSPEPPPEAWESISKKISPSGRGGMFAKIVLIPFLAASLFLFFTNPVSKDNSGLNLWDTITQEFQVAKNNIITKAKHTFNISDDLSQESENTTTINKAKDKQVQTTSGSYAGIKHGKHEAKSLPQAGKIGSIAIRHRKNIDFVQSKEISTFEYRNARSVSPKRLRRKEKSSWKIGLSYLPEFISYDSDVQFGLNGQNTNRQNNFYFTAQYLKNNYFIESGIGYGRVLDRSATVINYNKFMGTWEDLYDVTIETDANGQETKVYHYKTVAIYDTVSHMKYSDAISSYDYFQIPLFVGINKERGRINWTLKGGAIYSGIFNKSQNMNLNIEQNDVLINSEIKVPQRNISQVQVVLAAGIEYKITNKLSFVFEPSLKQNINNSFSTERKMTKPLSFGVRTGLYYKLK
jgi:hypothetical protein